MGVACVKVGSNDPTFIECFCIVFLCSLGFGISKRTKIPRATWPEGAETFMFLSSVKDAYFYLLWECFKVTTLFDFILILCFSLIPTAIIFCVVRFMTKRKSLSAHQVNRLWVIFNVAIYSLLYTVFWLTG